MRTDAEIRADVLAALKWSTPQFDHDRIHVVVKDRAVTLTGTAHDWREALCAERAAKRVKGVRAVAADIDVRPEGNPPADEALAERIARLLTWSSAFRGTNIQAVVRNGHVTLTGDVELLSQRELASRRIEDLEGVTRVSNEITVRTTPDLNEHELEQQIVAALHRHADVEASNVRITVADATVTLEGTVGAYHERDVIEDAVRSAVGVRRIVDNLTVV